MRFLANCEWQPARYTGDKALSQLGFGDSAWHDTCGHDCLYVYLCTDVMELQGWVLTLGGHELEEHSKKLGRRLDDVTTTTPGLVKRVKPADQLPP